jgi:hypothetical protein
MRTKKASIRHLKWLIEQRGQNNVTALRLLTLFENHKDAIKKAPYASYAQNLVGVAFSLWRAAFLSETKGTVAMKSSDAERFLRKMLTDNNIAFSQDMEMREWSVNYYIYNARFRLEELVDKWGPEAKIPRFVPTKKSGKRHSKGRWGLAHDAFDKAVSHLEALLKKAKNDKQNPSGSRRKRKR